MANIQVAATPIADLNDEFRRRGTGGSRTITAGILGKGPAFAARAIAEITACSLFATASPTASIRTTIVIALSYWAITTSAV